jgi:hypothetical protein
LDPVYIHLDRDVLDPLTFPPTPFPVADGLHERELFAILEVFRDKLVGLGIYDHISSLYHARDLNCRFVNDVIPDFQNKKLS